MNKFKVVLDKTQISKSLTRLELEPSSDSKNKIKVIERIEMPVIKEIPIEFILIIYGIMTLEITCMAAVFCDEVNVILLFFREHVQIIKLDNSGHFKSSKIIKLAFECYDSFSMTSDTLVFLKESKIVLFNRIQIK